MWWLAFAGCLGHFLMSGVSLHVGLCTKWSFEFYTLGSFSVEKYSIGPKFGACMVGPVEGSPGEFFVGLDREILHFRATLPPPDDDTPLLKPIHCDTGAPTLICTEHWQFLAFSHKLASHNHRSRIANVVSKKVTFFFFFVRLLSVRLMAVMHYLV